MMDTSKETVEWVAWALEHATDPEAERPTPPSGLAHGVTLKEVARILRALLAERDSLQILADFNGDRRDEF